MRDAADPIVITAEKVAFYAAVLDVLLNGLEIPRSRSQRVQLLLLRDRLSGEFDGTK